MTLKGEPYLFVVKIACCNYNMISCVPSGPCVLSNLFH